MSDLIAKLAKQLVALNNFSPRLPTQAEIEKVLRDGGAEISTPTASETANSFWRVGKVRFRAVPPPLRDGE